jgi:hypothetical protein
MAPKRPSGYRTISLALKKRGTVPVRTSSRTASALEEISGGMDLFQGVRLTQILEAVYEQGRKDGAHEVIDGFEKLAKTIPHKAPGRPKRP